MGKRLGPVLGTGLKISQSWSSPTDLGPSLFTSPGPVQDWTLQHYSPGEDGGENILINMYI